MRRLVTAAALGLVSIAALTGWYIARKLTEPQSARSFSVRIHGTETSGNRTLVTLDRTRQTTSRGTFSLILESGALVRLGPDLIDHGTHVSRAVLVDSRDELHAGQRASWSGIYYSSPADAALEATDVAVPTAAGISPAWLIEARAPDTDAWAIHIHGLGSNRAAMLRGAQVAADAGLTSLIVTYRNDGEGPPTTPHRSTLGVTETDDVETALQYAVDHGAKRVVIFGWSMGAAIALRLASSPQWASHVVGLILNSPVLDWATTLRANCIRAGAPASLAILALPWLTSRQLARATGLSEPVPLREFNWLTRANELAVPVLLLHGTQDTSTPFTASATLARLRPDLVTLVPFAADHAMEWNVDPERWRRSVKNWLESQLDRKG